MLYKSYYHSPLGKIILVSDEESLVGLWIEGQKYYLGKLKDDFVKNDNIDILVQTKEWLDLYFNGFKPCLSLLKLNPQGTSFQQKVWEILCDIPYGQIMTYGEIAKIIAQNEGKSSMSAQAIGGAVGHNPISIIIPCHRVLGKDRCLTGYAGGIDKKKKLLQLEKIIFKES